MNRREFLAALGAAAAVTQLAPMELVAGDKTHQVKVLKPLGIIEQKVLGNGNLYRPVNEGRTWINWGGTIEIDGKQRVLRANTLIEEGHEPTVVAERLADAMFQELQVQYPEVDWELALA